MEKTVMKVGTDYMDFVCKFHETIRKQNIILVYEGEINQSITKAFTSMTEQSVETEASDSSLTQKRLYHVMVECLQNVSKHAESEIKNSIRTPGRGIFIVSTNEKNYAVTTGNIVSNDKIETITAMLTNFNALNPDKIKEEYRKMIKISRLSEKAGAGLGFIDIVKKTGNKIEFHFEKINDETSFFVQNSIINR